MNKKKLTIIEAYAANREAVVKYIDDVMVPDFGDDASGIVENLLSGADRFWLDTDTGRLHVEVDSIAESGDKAWDDWNHEWVRVSESTNV